MESGFCVVLEAALVTGAFDLEKQQHGTYWPWHGCPKRWHAHGECWLRLWRHSFLVAFHVCSLCFMQSGCYSRQQLI